jgi:uncharacterized protein
LPAGIKRAVKRADRISAWHEATQLAGFTEAEATRFFGPPAIPDLPLTFRPPAAMRAAYAARVAALLP